MMTRKNKDKWQKRREWVWSEQKSARSDKGCRGFWKRAMSKFKIRDVLGWMSRILETSNVAIQNPRRPRLDLADFDFLGRELLQ
jgi:hypothetical protein